ncbi:UvrD-helicase domain-containing protein, partial [bacterium]|nr:UvrD-helicase domain-containing protein [bacterium]
MGCYPQKRRDEISNMILEHNYSEGPLLILAGPGTGKTYSLLETIKKRVSEGSDHHTFYEVTLTNASADDFIQDARETIDTEFNSSSTLHYRAKGILHRYSELLGINNNFHIIDDNYDKYFINDICEILEKDHTVVEDKLKEYKSNIAYCNYCEDDFSVLYKRLAQYYNAIDWYNVVAFTCKLLEDNEETRSTECLKYTFMLVDEYQDLNSSDQYLVKLLTNVFNLLVVGDDDQSIYSFRFADPSGMQSFEEFYPDYMCIKLPVTSRLPSNIINASYNLIINNKNRKEKDKLIPLTRTNERANNGFVMSVNLKSGKQERDFIHTSLEMLLTEGVEPKEILVLCNCKALGNELYEYLIEKNSALPLTNLLQRKEISLNKMILDHIKRFLKDQNDNLSLRFLLDQLEYYTSSKCSEIVKDTINDKIPLWQIIKKIDNGKLSSFVKLIEEALLEETLDSQILHVVSSLHNSESLIQELDGKKEEDSKSESELVRFLTIHNSKGLDADFVFIPFMEESIGL